MLYDNTCKHTFKSDIYIISVFKFNVHRKELVYVDT